MADKLTSIFCRVFFVIALILVFIAVLERILRFFGWTLSLFAYQPGRIFEFSGIFMIFVIALLLRQIRDRLKNT